MDERDDSYSLKDVIEGIRSDLKKIREEDIPSIRAEIEVLKVKAGIWGMIGGIIPIVIGLLLWLIKGNLK